MFLKICLLGAPKVGKSSLLSRFCSSSITSTASSSHSQQFDPVYHESLSVDFSGCKVVLQPAGGSGTGGREAIVQMWDIPGAIGLKSAVQTMRELKSGRAINNDTTNPSLLPYYRDTHVCVLICDLCSHDSFTLLDSLRLDFLSKLSPSQTTTVEFILLINKSEPTNSKKQEVYAAEVIQYCSVHNIRHFYECSALTDTNISIILLNMIQLASEVDYHRRGIKVKPGSKLHKEMEGKEKEEERMKEEEKEKVQKEKERKEREENGVDADKEIDPNAASSSESLTDEQRRSLEFESKWAQLKSEEEVLRKKQEEESLLAAAKLKEEKARKLQEKKLSVYGSFKQRPHRLSKALIEKRKGKVLKETNSGTSGTHSVRHAHTTSLGSGTFSTNGTRIDENYGEEEEDGDDGEGDSDEDNASDDATTHDTITAIPSPSPPPQPPRAAPVKRRPSQLGMGVGGLFKKALNESLGHQQQHDVTPSSSAASTSTAGRPQTREKKEIASGSIRGLRKEQQLTATSIPSSEIQNDSPVTPIPNPQPPSHEDEKSLSTSTVTLLDSLLPQISFTRIDCIKFMKLWCGLKSLNNKINMTDSSPSLHYSKWHKRVWKKIEHVHPSYHSLSYRVFSVCDELREGKINFGSFMRFLDTLFNGTTERRSEMVWKLLDLRRAPFRTTADAGKKISERKEDEEETSGQQESSVESSQQVQPSSVTNLTRAYFESYHRNELCGLDRFVDEMYDDEDEEMDSSFLTRADIIRGLGLLLDGSPALQHLERIVDSWYMRMDRARVFIIRHDEWMQEMTQRDSSLIACYLPKVCL